MGIFKKKPKEEWYKAQVLFVDLNKVDLEILKSAITYGVKVVDWEGLKEPKIINLESYWVKRLEKQDNE